ncbi:glutathione S-transferase family protein [Acidisoma cellulosilytica]|uniref:Glutathione S-transferase family protein n=1 Tax=Acidisoma cellulosilyticum TaxID=2802395 RepID=A0A964E5X9_9PROT|nr:glutathione S-transferase family protein [Acidisoma cellulosilyticum]MCB8882991.1 glutathione S-transferase family protein [Acidisoma cellulosilyticum]
MLKLLGRNSSSNVQKVLWLLTELGLPFERHDYGGAFGRNKDAQYLRLNPNGLVPTIIDGEVVIWESNTILRYLANKSGPSPFYPTEPAARAYCERWMDWQLGTLNTVMTPLYIALIRCDPAARDLEAIRGLEARARANFDTLNQCLAETPFLAGGALTLADIALGIFAYRWYTLEVERGPELPRLRAWYERLQDRQAFREHVMIGLS